MRGRGHALASDNCGATRQLKVAPHTALIEASEDDPVITSRLSRLETRRKTCQRLRRVWQSYERSPDWCAGCTRGARSNTIFGCASRTETPAIKSTNPSTASSSKVD